MPFVNAKRGASMSRFSEPKTITPAGQPPDGGEHEIQDARAIRGPRPEANPATNPALPTTRERLPKTKRPHFRWKSALLPTAAAIGFFWWVGNYLSSQPARKGFSPRPPAAPARSQTKLNNDAIARRSLIANLRGTAVMYREELRGLAAPDERFSIDLSLGRLADLLKINPQAIAKKGSPTEIDPDAVLFTAIAGRPSERAKARSRSERQLQARNGLPVDYTASEWVTQEFPFTLNALKHPSDEQKAILRAIWRSAREIMPEPGEKFRALAVSRPEIQSGSVDFKPGYLPLEHPSGGAGATGQ
jgi:hypothetical protein